MCVRINFHPLLLYGTINNVRYGPDLSTVASLFTFLFFLHAKLNPQKVDFLQVFLWNLCLQDELWSWTRIYLQKQKCFAKSNNFIMTNKRFPCWNWIFCFFGKFAFFNRNICLFYTWGFRDYIKDFWNSC